MRAIHLLALLLLTAPAAAITASEGCSEEGTFDDFLDLVSTGEAGGVAEIVSEKDLARRATGDGFAEGRLDTLRRAFVGLGLGTVDEDDQKLVFSFNPDLLETAGNGQVSPRLIVHEATLYEPLTKHLAGLAESDPAGAAQRAAGLEEQLGDLDDVELHLRWTTRRGDEVPEELWDWADQIFAARISTELQAEIANALAHKAEEIGRALLEERESAGLADTTLLGDTPMKEICSYPSTKRLAMELANETTERLSSLRTDLHAALTEGGFFRLADLLDGRPTWTAEGSWRRREDVVGPDSGTISLRYGVGITSLAGFRRWAVEHGQRTTAESLPDYLRGLRAGLPRVSLELAYTDRKEFRSSIPGNADFRSPGGTQLSGTLRAGGYLDALRIRRLELEATYDDVSDDPARQDRFVGTLSWVEKVSPGLASMVGGSELVVSLVYGSKPEFRGEVDEELGLRAGLKWSVGEPK